MGDTCKTASLRSMKRRVALEEKSPSISPPRIRFGARRPVRSPGPGNGPSTGADSVPQRKLSSPKSPAGHKHVIDEVRKTKICDYMTRWKERKRKKEDSVIGKKRKRKKTKENDKNKAK